MADEALKTEHGHDEDVGSASQVHGGGSNVADEGGTLNGAAAQAKQALTDGAGQFQQQAFDKARSFAEDGKARVGGALDQLVQMLTDAAATVDEKLGDQYGQYARTAADTVSGLSDQVKAKDVDALVGDAKELVRKSPAIAIGVAAAVGFAAIRLIQSGLDADKV